LRTFNASWKSLKHRQWHRRRRFRVWNGERGP